MTGAHSDIGPEMRRLAQTILDRLDPAVRLAAARATSGSESLCQQVWCPVCALAALVTGEQHPLLAVVAEHSVALLSVVRAMADAVDAPDTRSPMDTSTPPAGPPGGDDDPPPSRYQHITVTVEE